MGSHEYTNAIIELDQLVAISNPEEIQAYNNVIAEQVEFGFSSGQQFEPPSPNNSAGSGNRNNVDATKIFGQRRSLQWMLALARVEIGASLSMYGHIGNAFFQTQPEDFGVEEYGRLVADDAVAHVSALQTDEKIQKRVRSPKRVDSDTVAYLRRLKVVSDMLEYTRENAPEEIASMAVETSPKLKKARRELSRQIEVATLDSVYQNSEIENRSSEGTFRTNSYGNDIVARTAISRACQRIFLNGNQSRPDPNN